MSKLTIIVVVGLLLITGCDKSHNEPTTIDLLQNTYETESVVEPDNSNESSEDDTLVLIEREGKTAVITKDTQIIDVYTFTYSDTFDLSTWSILDGMQERSVTSGTMVWRLADVGDMSRVALMGADYPPMYGYVDTNALSMEPEKIKDGNQAIAEKGTMYTGIDGELLPDESGTVRILSQAGDWVSVEYVNGGATPQTYWVRRDDLNYNMDMVLIDFAD